MNETSGNMTVVCSQCGHSYLVNSGHTCPTWHSSTPQRGWICPVCGRGNAPWNPTCDCSGVDTTQPADSGTWPMSETITDDGNYGPFTVTAIPAKVHERLLKESLEIHDYLWARLARR